ncbi:MAG: cytochrome c oxidase subunit II [Pseudomonadota bacterium]
MKKIAKNLSIRLLQLLAFVVVCGGEAFAYEPKQAGLGLQNSASPRMDRLIEFHDLLLVIITLIVIFVTALLVWVMIRYNRKANPTPATFTHNVPIEILWTVVPVVILIIIAIPSFKMLYYLDRVEDPDMTLKVSGYQWGWEYSYPDYEIEAYRADMITDDDLDTYIPEGLGRRLLETYNPIVLPINQNIQVIVTASDVIHSWTVPAFGVKKDAVPGRLNETWVLVTKPGVYFGQCSEICGINHAYMPIAVYAVPEEEFVAWTECIKTDEAQDADYPARACVQKFDFDKYRQSRKKDDELAFLTGAEE